MVKARNKLVEEGPDGGWGWMIVIATFIVYGMAGAMSWSLGSFYIQFQRHFNTNAEKASWILSIESASTACFGLVGSLMASRIGARLTVLVGGVLIVSGFIISSFATSVIFLCFTTGLMPGVGFAICMPPVLATMGQYFPKRYPLVNSIATLGPPVFMFAFPLVIQTNIQVYGWRGAFLVLGAITANVFVGGLLLRPLPKKQTQMAEIEHLPETKQMKKRKSCYRKPIPSDIEQCIMHMVSVFFLGIALNGLMVHLQPRAIDNSVGAPHLIAILQALVGVSSIITRITVGIVIQKNLVSATSCHIVSLSTASIPCFIPHLARTYIAYCVFSVVSGLSSGVYLATFLVCTREYVGQKRFLVASAVALFIFGIGVFIGPPFAGWLFDVTGNYDYSFYMIGTVYILAACSSVAGKLLRAFRDSTTLYTVNDDTADTHREFRNIGIQVSLNE
uniref:Monocarboxylate transporter 12-like n=1 Tax=Saccoglossus kowalevskii TaxID=10224 RepID=A0ABM0GMP7_SACKO|nr:PREDICTED: monocarboxylate transporter 12-like [Saccoglossus kowalevskii]